MKFEIIGEIVNVETIAQGNGIRDLPLLRASLKIQSSPKCKAQKKFRRAAYV
jgi:soluble P-type ATPase